MHCQTPRCGRSVTLSQHGLIAQVLPEGVQILTQAIEARWVGGEITHPRSIEVVTLNERERGIRTISYCCDRAPKLLNYLELRDRYAVLDTIKNDDMVVISHPTPGSVAAPLTAPVVYGRSNY